MKEFDLKKFIEKHNEDIKAIREDYLMYYANISKEATNGIHYSDGKTEDTEDKED